MPRRYIGFWEGLHASPGHEPKSEEGSRSVCLGNYFLYFPEIIAALKKLSLESLNTVSSESGSLLSVAARYNRPAVASWLLENPLFHQTYAHSKIGDPLREAIFADVGWSFHDQRSFSGSAYSSGSAFLG